MKFINDFKSFITRGNVMNLAVGIIIGGAFGKIVSSLVADIVMPLISLITGQGDFSNFVWILKEADGDKEALVIRGGLFIQNIIDFLIIAFCIFIIIRIITKTAEKLAAITKKEAEETAETPSEPSADEKTLALLTDIKELLTDIKAKK